ncbi:MAG: hypothetical protein DRN20_02815 [Thermoplasmata archaeon]|nr:MAG: hypothetical protein DRN20_02815 [Thermoplasmata archaeon]
MAEKGGEGRNGRKKLYAIIPAALILMLILYTLVIPRLHLVIAISYSEGIFNTFDIDVVIKNAGNRAVNVTKLAVSLVNSTGTTVGKKTVRYIEIKPWKYYNMEELHILGDENNTHNVTYSISLTLIFKFNGYDYKHFNNFTTEEPYVRMDFREDVRG